jgi:hypothetical protein
MPLCVLLLMGITSFTLFGVVGFSLIRPNQRGETLASFLTIVNEQTYRFPFADPGPARRRDPWSVW